MKVKYRPHPNQYELGENEQFYSNMEEKGWRLVKRGAYLSKFVPVEPSAARYRIEVYRPGGWDPVNMPEEQLAVFEDCGWEHVAERQPLQIFRAPAGSGAPEFYVEPEQQAETLKRMKRDAIWGWVPGVLMWGLYWVMIFLMQGSAKISGQFQKALVEAPPLFLLIGFLLLEAFYSHIRSAWLITRTYRRLKRGVPLDHDPRRNRWLHRTVSGVLWGLAVFSAALLAAQYIGTNSEDMPPEADGPYYLLKDVGLEGRRNQFMEQDNSVTFSWTLLADYWDTRECTFMDFPEESRSVMAYQDIYRLRNKDMARWLAEALMKAATFGDGGANFVPLETGAVDAAWVSRGLEVVAVKGPYVAYVCQTGWSSEFDALAICDALAARWD